MTPKSYSIGPSPRLSLPTYRALIELSCDNCGETICVGDVFYRCADKAMQVAGIRYTVCHKCVGEKNDYV